MIEIKGQGGDEQQRRGLQRQLDSHRLEEPRPEPAQRPPAVDLFVYPGEKIRRRFALAQRAHHGDGPVEVRELPPAIRAGVEVLAEQHVLERRQAPVQIVGSEIPRLFTGHKATLLRPPGGQSALTRACTSARARWSLERTVPSSTPRQSAISSYERPSTSRRMRTILCSSCSA